MLDVHRRNTAADMNVESIKKLRAARQRFRNRQANTDGVANVDILSIQCCRGSNVALNLPFASPLRRTRVDIHVNQLSPNNTPVHFMICDGRRRNQANRPARQARVQPQQFAAQQHSHPQSHSSAPL